ncbi:MAG: hypothetical protein ACE5ED_12685 [Rhodothalassiaceae bacterium]
MHTLGAIAGLLLAAGLAPSAIWPRVEEIDRRFDLDLVGAEEFVLRQPITDSDGHVRYLFVCRGGGGSAMMPVHSSPVPHLYDRPLTCALHPGEEEGWGNLLARPYDVRDSDMRGYFAPEDLVPPCDRVPELGRERSFRLRGMRLSIRVVPVPASLSEKRSGGRETTTDDPKSIPERLSLRLTVENDPSALTAQAETPKIDPAERNPVRLQSHCTNIDRFAANRELDSRCLDVRTWAARWDCLKAARFEPFIWEIRPYSGDMTETWRKARLDRVAALPRWIRNFPEAEAWPGRLMPDHFSAYAEWLDGLKTRIDQAVLDGVSRGRSDALAPFLPPRPFLFQCGEPGTARWHELTVETEADWSRLWARVAREVRRLLGPRSSPTPVRLSELYGFWYWGGLVHLQDALTIGSTIDCERLVRETGRP